VTFKKLITFVFSIVTLQICCISGMEKDLSHYRNNKHVNYIALSEEKIEPDAIKELIAAIKSDDLEAVKSIITSTSDINLNTSCIQSNPLFIATLYNRVEIAEYLLLHGAKVNAVLHKDKSMILHCIESYKMLRVFINENTDWNLADDPETGEPFIVTIIKHQTIKRSEKIRMIKLLAPSIDIHKKYRILGEFSELRTPLTVAQELEDSEIFNVLVKLKTN